MVISCSFIIFQSASFHFQTSPPLTSCWFFTSFDISVPRGGLGIGVVLQTAQYVFRLFHSGLLYTPCRNKTGYSSTTPCRKKKTHVFSLPDPISGTIWWSKQWILIEPLVCLHKFNDLPEPTISLICWPSGLGLSVDIWSRTICCASGMVNIDTFFSLFPSLVKARADFAEPGAEDAFWLISFSSPGTHISKTFFSYFSFIFFCASRSSFSSWQVTNGLISRESLWLYRMGNLPTEPTVLI